MDSQQTICNLSAALARMGGSVEILKQLAEFLYDDAPALLARLKSAAEGGDAQQVHQVAHSLKGLVVNFDAEAAREVAGHLERMGQAGDLNGVTDRVRDFEHELDRLIGELKLQISRLVTAGDHSK